MGTVTDTTFAPLTGTMLGSRRFALEVAEQLSIWSPAVLPSPLQPSSSGPPDWGLLAAGMEAKEVAEAATSTIHTLAQGPRVQLSATQSSTALKLLIACCRPLLGPAPSVLQQL